MQTYIYLIFNTLYKIHVNSNNINLKILFKFILILFE